MDGEAVLVDVDDTHYYGLNRVGTFVWTLLADRALSRDEIIARVAAEYGQRPADVAGDVAALLDDLVREHLIGER